MTLTEREKLLPAFAREWWNDGGRNEYGDG